MYVFNLVHAPTRRAAAVRWAREPGGPIQATHVRDFGILPMSLQGKRLFETLVFNPQGAGLPPVPREWWFQHRHAPIAPQKLPVTLQESAHEQILLAVEDLVRPLLPTQELTVFYGGEMPSFRFSGVALRAFLHNLPLNWPVIQDFVLDLGSVFFAVQVNAPPRPQSIETTAENSAEM